MTNSINDGESNISEKADQNSQDVHGKSSKKKSKRKLKSSNNEADSTVMKPKESKIKPIIKNGNVDTAEISEDFVDGDYSYRKKRNKSVSFLIEDGEQEAKKSKSNSAKNETEVVNESKRSKSKPKKEKKLKEPENDEDVIHNIKKKDKMHSRIFRNKTRHDSVSNTNDSDKNLTEESPVSTLAQEATIVESEDEKRKKKNKKRKKQNSICETEVEEPIEKTKQEIKKSHSKAEGDNVPVKKAKKDKERNLPEAIADDLETLNIGDNPHSLTSLLDDMTVSDKNKQKKNKKELKKNKTKQNTPENEEIKEKNKWKKRKWNKGRTSTLDSNWLQTTVIVENIPLTCMLNYKEMLKEKFADAGTIKNIGIAELYPTVVSKPVFSTTVQFNDEESATKAVDEDNTLLENNRIRVLRPLEPNSTTIVVRSYGELNDQNLSSIFNGVGKIRNIRHLDKSSKKMATTFIEFDGPESQAKAIEIGNGMKIGSKKLHVCKFEERRKQQENRENLDQNVR